MKDKIFGVLQRVGRSFMLPIALLPVAGLLLVWEVPLPMPRPLKLTIWETSSMRADCSTPSWTS